MKGLIIKDFINLKKTLKIFVVISLLYFVIGITSNNPGFFSNILCAILAVTTISLFSYDDLAKWDVYVLTMPIKRETIIMARYIMMLLLALIGAAFSAVLTVASGLYLKKGIKDELIGIVLGTSLIILLLSIIIPFVVKLGVERARLILVAIYFIPVMVFMMLKQMFEKRSLEIPNWLIKTGNIAMKYIYIIIPLTLLLVLAFSYLISVRLYNKKEL